MQPLTFAQWQMRTRLNPLNHLPLATISNNGMPLSPTTSRKIKCLTFISMILELFPYTRELVAESKMMAISDTQLLLHDNPWYYLLGRWLLLPVPYQLWFIRVLIIYNLAYPAIRWCVTHKTIKWIFFTVAMLL